MVTGVGTLGICYVVQKKDRFYFKDGNIIWLKKRGEVSSRFVEYAFKSDFLRKQIDDSVGATVGTYTIIKAKNTLIPLPSLPEQQRTVAILDEIFAGLATATANAEKNLESARELFEGYLNSIFEERGPGWIKRTIEDIAEVKGGKRVPKGYKLLTEPTKHPYISVSCFDDEGGIDRTELRYISDEVFQGISRYIVSPRDVYVSIAAAQPKLALVRLRTVSLYVPPLAEQLRIASKLDDLAAETKRLDVLYRCKISKFAELKNSILQKAFSGELTFPSSQAIQEAAE